MKKWFPPTGVQVPALAGLDEAMRQYMQQYEIPRGVIAVEREGKLVFARGYTYDDDEASSTNPASLFRIASCSKVVTQIAIAQLLEAGDLSLEDTVQSILQLNAPDGHGGSTALVNDPQPADPATEGHYFHAVTVRHLLSHQGGWNRDLESLNDPVSRDVDVASAIPMALPVDKWSAARYGAAKPQQFWPGTDTHYSNFGYALLGLIVEAKRGESYQTAVSRHVFAPLGVDRPRIAHSLTRLREPGEVLYVDAENRSGPSVMTPDRPIVAYPDGFENFTNFDSFGGWVLAAPDYVKLLSIFSTAKNQVLKSTTADDLLDFGKGSVGGVTTYSHSGVFEGTSTYVVHRSDNVSLAVFWNKNAVETFTYNGQKTTHPLVWNQILNAVTAQDWPSTDRFTSTDGLGASHWAALDTHPRTCAIAASEGHLYQLHSDGNIYRYTGAPGGWELLDSYPDSTQIVADGSALYQRHAKTGAVYRYAGQPHGWEQLDANPRTCAIAASGGHLYQLHSDGNIYRYTGAPGGWELLDSYPDSTQIVADGSALYQRHAKTGAVYRYIGQPHRWDQLSSDQATTDIAAGGGQLYQLHGNAIWRYTTVRPVLIQR